MGESICRELHDAGYRSAGGRGVCPKHQICISRPCMCLRKQLGPDRSRSEPETMKVPEDVPTENSNHFPSFFLAWVEVITGLVKPQRRTKPSAPFVCHTLRPISPACLFSQFSQSLSSVSTISFLSSIPSLSLIPPTSFSSDCLFVSPSVSSAG